MISYACLISIFQTSGSVRGTIGPTDTNPNLLCLQRSMQWNGALPQHGSLRAKYSGVRLLGDLADIAWLQTLILFALYNHSRQLKSRSELGKQFKSFGSYSCYGWLTPQEGSTCYCRCFYTLAFCILDILAIRDTIDITIKKDSLLIQQKF